MIPFQPIFIVGVPRSGTTALHRSLSRHPDLSWLSGLAIRYPQRPVLNRVLMDALALPLIGHWLQRRFRPWEGYDFWEHYYPGFRRPARDLRAEDVRPEAGRQLSLVLAQLAGRRRPRLLLKLTGWPRLGLLAALFPDARFIHLIRDGRAVASSLLASDFWRGWEGPAGWRWGRLSVDQAARWRAAGGDYAALAGLQWEILLAAADEAQARLPAGKLLTVHYEALCDQPGAVLREILNFVDLLADRSVIGAPQFSNQNDKWRRQLSLAQQAALNQILAPTLPRYGYDPI